MWLWHFGNLAAWLALVETFCRSGCCREDYIILIHFAVEAQRTHVALPTHTQTSFYSLSDVCSVAWCWLFHVRVPVRLCVCLPWRSVSVSCFLDPPSVPFSWTRCSPSVSSSAPVGFCPKLTLVLNQQALFFFFFFLWATSCKSKVLSAQVSLYLWFVYFPKYNHGHTFCNPRMPFVCRPSACDLMCCQGGALTASINISVAYSPW